MLFHGSIQYISVPDELLHSSDDSLFSLNFSDVDYFVRHLMISIPFVMPPGISTFPLY